MIGDGEGCLVAVVSSIFVALLAFHAGYYDARKDTFTYHDKGKIIFKDTVCLGSTRIDQEDILLGMG